MAHLAHLDHRLPEKIDGLEIHNIIRSWQDKMPSFRSFFQPGYLLWTILFIMNLIAFVFCMVHINRFEELTWYGIWGFPHLVFAVVCGVAFTIGVYFDPRKPPSVDLLVMERTRYWGIVSFLVTLVILNVYPFGEAYKLSTGLFIFKILSTYVTILFCAFLLMHLFVQETIPENGDVQDHMPPKTCCMVLHICTTISIMYIVMILIHDRNPVYENVARGLVIISTYQLILFMVAVMAGVYREPVRRIHAIEEVVVVAVEQPSPDAHELNSNPNGAGAHLTYAV